MPAKDAERRKEYNRRYYLSNAEKIKEDARNDYREHVEERKKKSRDYVKNGSQWFYELRNKMRCFECGDERFYVLEMHHLTPSEKSFKLSLEKIARLERSVVEAELKKTVPLCSNCHIEIHYLHREMARSLEGLR